jgi:cytosine/adenosine deaminase-related metal-dependent hydrolase
MKYFSAQYIFTNNGPPLKRGIITTDDDGTIISVEDTGGILPERHSLEFYNGIIVPGFVNCHCHLELSWMKDRIPEQTGLGGFLSTLTGIRSGGVDESDKAIASADRSMADEGVVLCADICNSSSTFSVKKKSRIRYINFLEVFGIDPASAEKRLAEIMKVAEAATANSLEWYLVPHSVYSVSLPLFRMLREKTGSNKFTSVHFLESEDETGLLSEKSGPLMDAYKKMLSPSVVIIPVKDHLTAVFDEITPSGNLILVHNTAIEQEQVRNLKNRPGIFYCLCPGSNRYITDSVPPLNMLASEGCKIVIGTDSLSSNNKLSILNEIRILQDEFPETHLTSLIEMATLTGAEALGAVEAAGSIEPGKKPGLVLIRDADLEGMRLLPSSSSVRLI